MKVDQDAQLAAVLTQKTENKPNLGGKAFAQALNQAAKGSAEADRTGAGGMSPTRSCESVSPLGEVLKASLAGPYSRVEETINLLDEYAHALEDPGRSLKDLAAMAQGLEAAASEMNQISQLTDDERLKEMAGKTGVAAIVEAMKFSRGDYL